MENGSGLWGYMESFYSLMIRNTGDSRIAAPKIPSGRSAASRMVGNCGRWVKKGRSSRRMTEARDGRHKSVAHRLIYIASFAIRTKFGLLATRVRFWSRMTVVNCGLLRLAVVLAALS